MIFEASDAVEDLLFSGPGTFCGGLGAHDFTGNWTVTTCISVTVIINGCDVLVTVTVFCRQEVHMVGVYADGIIVVVGRKILLDLQELVGSVTVIVVEKAFVRGVVVYIEGVGGT